MYLLNDHFPKLGDSALHFLELYEIGGLMCQQANSMEAYFKNQSFDGLIICFDLNNLQSMVNMNLYLSVLASFNTLQ